MRHRKTIAAFLVLTIAAAAAVLVAAIGANIIENRSHADVQRILQLNGMEWVDVEADGLQVVLTGDAPDEATRFRALREAGRVVDAARLIDNMDILVRAPILPPRFSIEILQNDDGLSLIGLVPSPPGAGEVVEMARRITRADEIGNLLDEAAFPAPPGWDEALEYGLGALGQLRRSKISIAADRVEVRAISDSSREKRQLEAALSEAKPEGIVVEIDIAAPRPVITPFTLRFVRDEDGARFDACSATSEDGRTRILQAARQAGLTGNAQCTLGLGAPSPDWNKAVVAAIGAVGELGGGSVTFSDTDATLVGVVGQDRSRFDRVTANLKKALPEVFSLFAVLPEPEPEPGSDDSDGPPEFVATLSPEGQVQLSGVVRDERARDIVRGYARARFGAAAVSDALRLVENVPSDWDLRVLASVQGLSMLNNGLVRAGPEIVELRGNTGDPEARADVARVLSQQLGSSEDFRLAINYLEALDPLANIPTPEECVSRINAIQEESKISFAPSSADIDDAGREVIARIVEVMKECEHVEMEVGGHTDSQGREIMNLELSQARADAVVNALLARRVLTSNLTAKGYGETTPIADNDTEEGREINRRIEFRLIEAAEDNELETEGETSNDTSGGEPASEPTSGEATETTE